MNCVTTKGNSVVFTFQQSALCCTDRLLFRASELALELIILDKVSDDLSTLASSDVPNIRLRCVNPVRVTARTHAESAARPSDSAHVQTENPRVVLLSSLGRLLRVMFPRTTNWLAK